MKNKLHNIQALRALAVMLVVGLHLLAVEIKYSQYEVLLPTFLRIGISGVDLFFVISGYIMVAVTATEDNAAFSLRPLRFLFLRASRIYPLYWVVTAATLAVYLNHRSFINLPHFDFWFAVKSFLLIPQAGLPVLMVGWSLIHEMYFYLVFALFMLLPRRRLPYLLAVWLVVVAIGSRYVAPFTFNPDQNQFLRIVFSPLTVEFILGAWLALYVEARVAAQKTLVLPVFALVLGLLVLPVIWHFFSFNANMIDVAGWPRVYLFTGPFLLMLYGAVAFEKDGIAIAPTWLVRIGDHSYSIYLTHILVLSVCGRIWKTIAWPGYTDNVMMIAIALSGVLVTGALCFRFVEKPLLDLSRRVSGS